MHSTRLKIPKARGSSGQGSEKIHIYTLTLDSDNSRKPFSIAFEYLEENVNSVVQYGKKLMPSEVSQISEIPPGEGALVRLGGQQVAVYKG